MNADLAKKWIRLLKTNDTYKLPGTPPTSLEEFADYLDGIFLKDEPKKCTCDITELMNTGCKCGGV